MTKLELARKLANSIGTTTPKAEEALRHLGSIIAAELMAGTEVNLPGVGKFKLHARAARNGVNPSTGKAIKIAAKKVVKFSTTKILAAALNE